MVPKPKAEKRITADVRSVSQTLEFKTYQWHQLAKRSYRAHHALSYVAWPVVRWPLQLLVQIPGKANLDHFRIHPLAPVSDKQTRFKAKLLLFKK
jgi:hypothetical protein